MTLMKIDLKNTFKGWLVWAILCSNHFCIYGYLSSNDHARNENVVRPDLALSAQNY